MECHLSAAATNDNDDNDNLCFYSENPSSYWENETNKFIKPNPTLVSCNEIVLKELFTATKTIKIGLILKK